MLSVGKLILDYLHKHDKTQAQLARMLEETPQNLGRKLRGDFMSVEMLEKISDALEHNFFFDLSESYTRKHFNIENILNEPGMRYGSATSLDRYIELIVEKKVAEKLKGKS